MFKVGCALEHLYRIYSIPTHDKHQWLLSQFIVLLMMDAKGVPNMYSIPVVVNKHNTARVASCWFIIYYRIVMHGNSNIKFPLQLTHYFYTTYSQFNVLYFIKSKFATNVQHSLHLNQITQGHL